MSIAAALLTGCPLPPYGDGPPPGCQGQNCGDDDDDDDDDCAGKGGYGGGGGYGGTSGKAGSGGYAGSGGGGFPRTPIDLNEYQQLLRLDLASLPRAEQNDVVYVEFHAAYNNNRYSDTELAAFANATLKLLNQLDVVSTNAGNQGAVVVLSNEGLPMAVRFDTKRFNLDKQRDIVDTIARLNNRQDVTNPFPCDVVAIPGLDFLHVAANDDVFNPITLEFDSGYSNVALIKRLINAGFAQEGDKFFNPIPAQQFIANGFTNIANFDLYQMLEAVDPINFNRALLDELYNGSGNAERLVRGCLLNSNVSAANRCLDRLTQSFPANGTTYLSFDLLSFGGAEENHDVFAAGFVGPGNPAGDPLVRPQGNFVPFQIDSGTSIFQLPNQMLGFLTFNGNFQLLSNSPTYSISGVASDDGPLDLDVGAGGSLATCGYCHGSFTIPFVDTMLPTVLSSPQGPGAFDFAINRAQSQDSWDADFAIDAAFYQEALRNVYFTQDEFDGLADGIWSLGKQYNNDMTTEDVAAELGFLDAGQLCDALANEPDLEGTFFALCQGGGFGVARENYTQEYQNLVDNLGVGNSDFLRGCVSREVSDPGDTGSND